MTQISLFVTLVLAILVTFFRTEAAQKGSPPRTRVKPSLVRPIDQSRIGGCGCYFNFASDRQERCVFFSDLDEETASMNIDGRDVSLSLIKRVAPANEKVGSRSTEIYHAPGIKVTAQYITTAMCAPDDENCESTSYDATFTVIKAKRQQTVKLKGACGC